MVLRIRTLARAPVRRTPRGEMNGLERRYADRLEVCKQRGEIAQFWFEGMKLRLADKCWFSVDFMVQLIDGTIELHECKALWSNGKHSGYDDSRIKIRVVAETYPFRLVLAMWSKKTGWTFEDF